MIVTEIKFACTHANTAGVIKIVTLQNFDGCTSCMPSSPKEYICPCRDQQKRGGGGGGVLDFLFENPCIDTYHCALF